MLTCLNFSDISFPLCVCMCVCFSNYLKKNFKMWALAERERDHKCDALQKNKWKLKLGKKTYFVPIFWVNFQFGLKVFFNIQFSSYIVKLAINLVFIVISLKKNAYLENGLQCWQPNIRRLNAMLTYLNFSSHISIFFFFFTYFNSQVFFLFSFTFLLTKHNPMGKKV